MRELFDTEILDKAMDNAFILVTGEKTFEELIDEQDEVMLPFNIEEEFFDYDIMIEYYITTEEYEKCDILVKLKNKENNET